MRVLLKQTSEMSLDILDMLSTLQYGFFALARSETCRRLDANAQVEEFLTELYHGKPKGCDLARFTEKMKTFFVEERGNEASRVTLDDIRSAMAQLKKEVWMCSTHPGPGLIDKS